MRKTFWDNKMFYILIVVVVMQLYALPKLITVLKREILTVYKIYFNKYNFEK